jgi:UDP-galactopyranose mutase
MKLKNKTIVYFSPVDWNYNWQRQQEIASALAKNNTLLYIEPIGFFNWSFWKLLQKKLEKKRVRSGQAFATPTVPPKNVHVVQLFFIPRHDSIFFEYLNKFLMLRQIKKYLKELSAPSEIIFWSGNPARTVFQLKKELHPICVVYDNAMRFEELPGSPDYVLQHEKEAVQASTVVFTDNLYKFRQFQKIHNRVVRVPQGVDEKIFDVTKHFETPTQLAHVTGPSVGYYGSLLSVFDFPLYEKVLQLLPHLTFVAIGPIRRIEDIAHLLRHKNFIYVKPQLHTDLPKFLSCFDVCVIPYQVTDYTRGTFPTKLFEYLAFLKPIVAEPIEELTTFMEYLYLAETPETFAAAITDALKFGPKKPTEILSLVKNNTWSARFATIQKTLEETL